MGTGRRVRIAILVAIDVAVCVWLVSIIPSQYLNQVTTLVALVITAVATAVIAVANYHLILASRAQAVASQRMTEEVQRDRELEWAAYLVRELVGSPESIQLHNVGRGPALGCFYCPPPPTGPWRRTPVINLAPGEKQVLTIAIEDTLARPPASFFAPDAKPAEVWFCVDQVGRNYRFSSAMVQPEPWPPFIGASVVQPPAWVDEAHRIRGASRS